MHCMEGVGGWTRGHAIHMPRSQDNSDILANLNKRNDKN